MFLKFGNVPDREAQEAFDALETHCETWLRRWVDSLGSTEVEKHDYAVSMAMQLAYQSGVMAAVGGMHRDTLDAALKVGLAAFDEARRIETEQSRS